MQNRSALSRRVPWMVLAVLGSAAPWVGCGGDSDALSSSQGGQGGSGGEGLGGSGGATGGSGAGGDPVVCTSPAKGQTAHFVDASHGHDGDDGKTADTAWKSIDKVNAAEVDGTIKPGDQVLFKRGEIFAGTIAVTVSGTADSATRFASYGCGAQPVITGLVPLSGWTSEGGGVWKASCAGCGAALNTVLIDGTPRGVGRYPNLDAPNRGYLTVESHVDDTSITDSHLATAPTADWTGAEIVIRKNNWVLDRGPVTGQQGNTLSYTSPTDFAAIDGFGYFIQNHPATLDQPGEWSFDSVSKTVHLYAGDHVPAAGSVEVSALDASVTLHDQNYVVIDDLSLQGANVHAIDIQGGSHLTIQGATILYAGVNGIDAVPTSFLTVDGVTVEKTNNTGISCYECSDSIIRNSTVTDSGMVPGRGSSGNLSQSGIQLFGSFPTDTAGRNLIENNHVENSGYMGIGFEGRSITVRHNVVRRYTMTVDDAGGIYTWGDFDRLDRHVIGNVVLDGLGAAEGTNNPVPGASVGIYLDDRSANVEIADNTVDNASRAGIFLHNSHEITLTGNTTFEVPAGLQMSHQANELGDPTRNVTATGNVFFAMTPEQSAVEFDSVDEDVAQLGMLDHNYYVLPFASSGIITVQDPAGTRHYDVDTWHDAYGFDAHSHGSPSHTKAHYVIHSLQGADLIGNGTFDAAGDAGRVSCDSAPAGCQISWSASGHLDQGAVQVSPGGTPNQVLRSYVDLGSVVAGHTYVIRFSVQSGSPLRTGSAVVLQHAGSYAPRSDITWFDLGATRVDGEMLLTASDSEGVLLAFEVSGQDAPYWIDNVKMYKADVTVQKSADVVRFEYDAGAASKTFPLSQSYVDAQGTNAGSSLTLSPFTSMLLIER